MMDISADILSSAARCKPCPPDVQLGNAIALRRGRIHELTGSAGDMFALIATRKHAREIVWIGLRRDIATLCPAGLYAYIDPGRILLVEGVSRGELLWAAEQALRADGAFAVVLDMPDALSLRESRRLQLAAEESGALGLVCLHGPPASSAAQTRWHCEPVNAEQPSWLWHCVKGKSGEAGRWRVSCAGGKDAKDTLHLAATAAA